MNFQIILDWPNQLGTATFETLPASQSALPSVLGNALADTAVTATVIQPPLLQTPVLQPLQNLSAGVFSDSLSGDLWTALEVSSETESDDPFGFAGLTGLESDSVTPASAPSAGGFHPGPSVTPSEDGFSQIVEITSYSAQTESNGFFHKTLSVVSLTETVGEDFGAQPTQSANSLGAGSVVASLPDGSDVRIVTTGDMVVLDDTLLSPELTLSSHQISLDAFRSDPNFAGIDGSGFAVVILDTGIDLDHPHFGPDLDGNGVSDRIVYHYDFANGDSSAAAASSAHGTNVTGIAASSDPTYTGMAPGADIIHLKVFEDDGAGYFSYVENALGWVIANAATYNIASVNMSLSDFENHSTPTELYGIADEMALLAAQNIVVVSSSGNSFAGFNSVQGVAYPSADPNSLSVGAVYDSNDQITSWSQRHADLTDIFAPGSPITAAGLNGGLLTMSGTSMAAPHIAGIVALAQQLAVQELGRVLSVTEFSDLLTSTGKTINDGDDENDDVANTGLDFPLVDVQALGDAILALAPPPTLSISALDTVEPEGNTEDTTFAFSVTRSGNAHKTISVDYEVAGGGSQPAPFSGTLAHQSELRAGYHTHYFYGADYPWAVFSGETLFTQIYLDPLNLPSEIMLQWGAQDGWGHRAYWGNNDIRAGTDGTESRLYMGALPEAGKWVRLEVPANDVGLGNADLTGMAFSLYGGRATWDYSGVNDGFSDIVWVDDAVPDGAIAGGLFEKWDFTPGTSADATDFGGTLPSGTVNFAPGETTKIITIEVSADSAIEADEDFIVTLSNATDGAEIVDATVTATIKDDDAAPPSLSIVALDTAIQEGDTENTSFTFDVTRSGNTDVAVNVDFAITGNGTAPSPFSGELAHQSSLEEGFHAHYIYGTSFPWSVFFGETLFTQIYLDPLNTPSEVMLQWGAQDGWEHRAYWGNNEIDAGIDGTESRLYMGALPEAGKWVRLEVPADAVGLGNADLDGMFFTLYDGRATWDYTGVNDGFTDIAWVDDALPAGALSGGLFDKWDFTPGTSADATDFGGTLPSGTVNFAPGETTKTITIEVFADSAIEADEDFIITLSNATDGAEILNATTTGTIQDDDDASPPAPDPEDDDIKSDDILIDEELFVFAPGSNSIGDSGTADDIHLSVLGENSELENHATEIKSDIVAQLEDEYLSELLGVPPSLLDPENHLI